MYKAQQSNEAQMPLIISLQGQHYIRENQVRKQTESAYIFIACQITLFFCMEK